MNDKDKSIETFWHHNPVGSNFIEYESTKEFYERYDAFRYSTEGHILKELDQIDFKDKKVLEIGLGQGADSMQIINRGAVYYGIDLTEESIKRLKERFQLFNLRYQEVLKANAQYIPYENDFFDIVYSHGVIHHSPEIEKIVGEIFRVLKPGGRIIVMLYHKRSFNYYFSIAILRRLGLLLLLIFPFLIHVVSKLTGEDINRINGHRANFKKIGWKYFSMREFIHRSTDGPDNVYSGVWNKKTSQILFGKFTNIKFKIHFLNERHLLGLQKLLTKRFKNNMSQKFGWHLWIFANK